MQKSTVIGRKYFLNLYIYEEHLIANISTNACDSSHGMKSCIVTSCSVKGLLLLESNVSFLLVNCSSFEVYT